MSLSTELLRLENVRASDFDELADVIMNLQYGVRLAESMRDAVLRMHRDEHTTINPVFCADVCRLAAEL